VTGGGAVTSDRALSSVGLPCHPANPVQARTTVRRKSPATAAGPSSGEAECASKRKPTPRLYPTATHEAGSWARDDSRLHESGIRLMDRHNKVSSCQLGEGGPDAEHANEEKDHRSAADNDGEDTEHQDDRAPALGICPVDHVGRHISEGF
jgi:hypothetical protein